MNANVALAFPAPRAAVRPVRKVSVRRLVPARVNTARHVQLPPSLGARVENVLMGVTFLSLAGLAVIVEAVGTSLF